ncbi:MAG TPA: hypothetical protein VGV86_07405 [Acidimicrobiales bacterium]|nr:hypothetical protein [Acidimicrobiales bacterium]
MTELAGSGDAAEDQLLFTFRMLRCAIVAATLVLAVALVMEAARTGSIRGSISAYFYSPVRSIFVGCLMAIGLCLIAIQGKTLWEETSLNLGGLFAFVVALVPIRPDVCQLDLPAGPQTFDPSEPVPAWLRSALDRVAGGTCRLGEGTGSSPDGLPGWVVTGIRNNVISVMAVCAFAFVALVVMRRRSDRVRQPQAARAGQRALLIYLVLLILSIYLYARFDGIRSRSTSHYLAAGTMFFTFGLVVAINGWRREGVPRVFRNQYRTIAVLMVLVLPLGKLTSVYWLEAAEIALFAWFWTTQTVQIWDPSQPGAQAMLPAKG